MCGPFACIQRWIEWVDFQYLLVTLEEIAVSHWFAIRWCTETVCLFFPLKCFLLPGLDSVVLKAMEN